MNARVCQIGVQSQYEDFGGDNRGIFASLTVFGPAARLANRPPFCA